MPYDPRTGRSMPISGVTKSRAPMYQRMGTAGRPLGISPLISGNPFYKRPDIGGGYGARSEEIQLPSLGQQGLFGGVPQANIPASSKMGGFNVPGQIYEGLDALNSSQDRTPIGVAGNVWDGGGTAGSTKFGNTARDLGSLGVSSGNPIAAAAGLGLSGVGSAVDLYKYNPKVDPINEKFRASERPENTYFSRYETATEDIGKGLGKKFGSAIAGGAAAGTAVAPGIGTAIGAVGGALGAAFGFGRAKRRAKRAKERARAELAKERREFNTRTTEFDTQQASDASIDAYRQRRNQNRYFGIPVDNPYFGY